MRQIKDSKFRISLKESERYADAGKVLGKLFSEASSRSEFLGLTRDLLFGWTGCKNIGIRLLNDENEIPFETLIGYQNSFIENEKWLNINQDQCLCIRVSLQKFFKSDSAIRTSKGSIFSNNFIDFIDQLSCDELIQYRGACKLQNYASLAIIPIRCRDKVLGVIHLADDQKGLFSRRTIDFLETVVTYIGIALNRFNVEDELQRHNDTLGAVTEILNLAIGNTNLNEIIEHSLNILLSIPWLSFDSKGSIYLADNSGKLVLQAASGLEESHLESCRKIPFGHCHCGQAALQKEIQFTPDHYGDFTHGHYCVPILSEETVLGVINIYLRRGHHRNQKEEIFLTTIANTLAGIIIRKQSELETEYSYNQNKLILESMGEGIFGVDLNGNTIFINPKASQLTGYEQEYMIGRNQHYLIHHTKEDGTAYPREECPIYLTIKNGTKQMVSEDIFWRKDGSSFPVEYVSTPVWENEEIIGAVVVFKDITERKMAEKALRENEERYRSLIKQSSEGVFTFNPITKRIQEANEQLLKMLNYTEEEITKLTIYDIIESEKSIVDDNIRKTLESNLHIIGPRKYKQKDNSLIDVETSASMIKYNDFRVIMVNIRDITERKQSEEALKVSFENLTKTLNETVNALAGLAEKRDPYTAGHQQRVAQLATAIAQEMGLSAERIESIRIAGILHDIGKIYVPTEILNKPGRLNELEMSLIRTHSQVGYDVLKSIPFACPVAEIVWQHHEKINGTGYPLGLKQDEVLLEARILCVADVVEAIASHRPYRPSLGLDTALQEIKQLSGIVYDPDVVNACLNLFTQKGFEIH